MLDKAPLRAEPERVREQLARRGAGFTELFDTFSHNDANRRQLQVALDGLRAERNEISKAIGELMKSGKRNEGEAKKAEAQQINSRVADLEAKFEALDADETELLLSIPNL